MIARICSLPVHVANQIAAGEVIESPASVVKELLENALDAKSRSITIDIGFGGLNHIVVSDDGIGILSEDLPLVIAPHATSKLKVLDDLFTLETMGFRGEALASIAAISRFSLISKCAEEAHASRLHVDLHGFKRTLAARAQGTTIEVRDLFYNAPVRKKFLRSEQLEYLSIEAVVKRFALSEPGIELKLIHNDQVKLQLPAATCDTTRQLRLKKLFGKTFFEHATFVHQVCEKMSLMGWIGHPQWARSQSDKQWIYLNRRMVKDKLLTHAVRKAYEPLIHPGKHALYLLYLTMPAEDVDINVHPTKHEVRFVTPRLVHDFVYGTVHGMLGLTPEKEDKIENKWPIKNAPFQESPAFLWLTLNRRYAILAFENAHYIVNVVDLRLLAQLQILKDMAYPWVSRSLLFPVAILIENAPLIFETFQLILNDFGFHMLLTSDGCLHVHAIPAAVPLLNLHDFFQQLSQIVVDKNEILKLLLRTDAWNLQTMTRDEKESWWHYWQEGMQQNKQMPYTRIFSEEVCEVICCG